MATSAEYADFVCEQLEGTGYVSKRKMFGEYMVYLNGKPVFLVCDNTVFVKKLPEVGDILVDAECGYPYDGAKEHYILDIDDAETVKKVAVILEKTLPLPRKPKKKES